MARADVEAFSKSVRSRVLVLVLVLAAGLAAALWSGTRDVGEGQPEDRQRLMVVAGEAEIDYFAVLERGGFVVEVETLEGWLARARAVLPESEAEGLELLLALADERGDGFVVLESPQRFDFEGLELEPGPGEIEDFSRRDYAVLSVGDLAFPHRLSVDSVGELPFVQLPGHGALEALFAQPAILARDDEARPTVEELQYEADIRVAREMAERSRQFPTIVEGVRVEIIDALDGDPGAHRLLDPFETGSALPTPGGGILLVHHDLEIGSTNAETLDLEAGKELRFSWLEPEAIAAGIEKGSFVSTPCESLAGGSLSLEARPRLEAARDGSALTISTHGTTAVWHLAGPLDGEDKAGCRWEEVAELPELEGRGLTRVAPRFGRAARGLLALARRGPERTTIALWRTASSDPGEAPELVELLELPDSRVTELVFVEGSSLAALTRTSPPEAGAGQAQEHAVEIVDARRAGVHLRIPAELFAKGRVPAELVVAEPPAQEPDEAALTPGPSFVIVTRAPGKHDELVHLRVGSDAWSAFEHALATDGGGEDEGEVPGRELVTLTPEQLEVHVLARRSSIHSPAMGRGALAFASANASLPANMWWLPLPPSLEGGEPRQLTDNALVDGLPSFTADGRRLVISTVLQVSISPLSFSAPRLLELGR